MRASFILLALSAIAFAKPFQASPRAVDETALAQHDDEVAFAKDVASMVEQGWQNDLAEYDTPDLADKHKHKHRHFRKLIHRLLKKSVAREVALAVNRALAKLKAAGVITVPLAQVTLEVPGASGKTSVKTKEVATDAKVPASTTAADVAAAATAAPAPASSSATSSASDTSATAASSTAAAATTAASSTAAASATAAFTIATAAK